MSHSKSENFSTYKALLGTLVGTAALLEPANAQSIRCNISPECNNTEPGNVTLSDLTSPGLAAACAPVETDKNIVTIHLNQTDFGKPDADDCGKIGNLTWAQKVQESKAPTEASQENLPSKKPETTAFAGLNTGEQALLFGLLTVGGVLFIWTCTKIWSDLFPCCTKKPENEQKSSVELASPSNQNTEKGKQTLRLRSPQGTMQLP